MKGRKGQAALEFLMTYGWATLVVLVVIGALAYFGVLNPNILVPEKCTLQTGLACKDYKMTPDGLLLELENGMGKGIVVRNITINATQGSSSCYAAKNRNASTPMLNTTSSEVVNITAGDSKIMNGRSMSIYVQEGTNCNFPDIGRKTKMTIDIAYYFLDSSETFTHTTSGEMLVTLEE